MKIDIKPTIISCTDYHQFDQYGKNFMMLGFDMEIHELGFDSFCKKYKAITWVEGDEEELFYFIFNNEDVFEMVEHGMCY